VRIDGIVGGANLNGNKKMWSSLLGLFHGVHVAGAENRFETRVNYIHSLWRFILFSQIVAFFYKTYSYTYISLKKSPFKQIKHGLKLLT
jgi:hypothetical protein